MNLGVIIGVFDSGSMEFAKAVPTNGFGEIEATVVASLGHPGAPRPRPINTAKLKKKVCRIFSPVSVDRGIGGLSGWHRQDISRRPHTVDNTGVGQPRAREKAAAGPAEAATEATDLARVTEGPGRSRPMTSDSLSRRQHQHRQLGETAGRITSSRDTARTADVDQRVRPSTSGDRRRRGSAGRRGVGDRKSASDAVLNAVHRTSNGEENGKQPVRLMREHGQGQPSQGEREQRQHTSDLGVSMRSVNAGSLNQR